MKTSIVGLIPNAPFSVLIGGFILAGICVMSSGVNAAVDDWPATASSYFTEALENDIEHQQPAISMTCRPSVQISLDQNGQAVVTPAMLLVVPEYPLDM